MGGKAFKQFGESQFPRIPSAVYHAVKARLLQSLREIYEQVGVPREAPEKVDHGDLDFIVFGLGQTSLDQVKAALGATSSIELDGNRTSNFAVPVPQGEWGQFGHGDKEAEYRRAYGEIFYQVDVHVCEDIAEWNRIIFYHSYGDLGMILGLIARNNGLRLGTNGLKVNLSIYPLEITTDKLVQLFDPPNRAFELSASFTEILPFFGLSMDTWKQGFQTKLQVFEWVVTSRLFDPTSFRTAGDGLTKVKADRKMYAEFTSWVSSERSQVTGGAVDPKTERADIVDEALVYFNKKHEFEELARSRLGRVRMKAGFNGTKVNEWAGLNSNWRAVKTIMDEVRARVGGNEGVADILEEKGEEAVKRIVLEVKEALGL